MNQIERHVENVEKTLWATDFELVEIVAQKILEAHREGIPVLTCGNGGSAATAMHFAGDLRSIGIEAYDLLSPVKVTQIGNDIGYGYTFSLQSNDGFLVAFSCSGMSENVLFANADILFTSTWNDVEMEGLTVSVNAEPLDYESVEDVHLVLCHAIKNYLRKEIE